MEQYQQPNTASQEVALDLLEQIVDERALQIINRIRMAMEIPDLLQLQQALLAGFWGNRCSIHESEVRRGIDCIKRINEEEIDKNWLLSINEKLRLKQELSFYVQLIEYQLLLYFDGCGSLIRSYKP